MKLAWSVLGGATAVSLVIGGCCSDATVVERTVPLNVATLRLATNEVLKIAEKALSGVKLDGFVAARPQFGTAFGTNNWIVLFYRVPPVPDDDWIVLIDDRTGEAVVRRP